MSTLDTIQTRSPQKTCHHSDISAYQTFLDSDLDAVRKNMNGGRRPFGLLFDISPRPSDTASPPDHLLRLPQPTPNLSRPGQKRDRSPIRSPSPRSPNKARFGTGPEPVWEIYQDEAKENIAGCCLENMGVSWVEAGQEEEEDEGERTTDENEDIHQKARALAYLMDHVKPRVMNEPIEIFDSVAVETIEDGEETASDASDYQ